MNVKSVEKLEKSQVAVTVEVTAEEFEAAVQKAYLKMRKKISVPGFRPGQGAPQDHRGACTARACSTRTPSTLRYPDAYDAGRRASRSLDVVGYPEVEIVDDQIGKDGFTFKATVAVYPEVEAGPVQGRERREGRGQGHRRTTSKERLNLDRPSARPAWLPWTARSRRAIPPSSTSRALTTALPSRAARARTTSLELGSGSFVPGFEDQIIGMKAGEEKDIDITFPEDYTTDLAGKAGRVPRQGQRGQGKADPGAGRRVRQGRFRV